MTTWDNVDLTNFDTIPLNELIPDKKYIMLSKSPDLYPNSRRLIIFNSMINDWIINMDILASYDKYGGIKKKFEEGVEYGTSIWNFYDYDKVLNSKINNDIASSFSNTPARLSVLALNQLPSSMIPYANQMGMLGVQPGKYGGYKKKTRRKNKRSQKSKRFNRRSSKNKRRK